MLTQAEDKLTEKLVQGLSHHFDDGFLICLKDGQCAWFNVPAKSRGKRGKNQYEEKMEIYKEIVRRPEVKASVWSGSSRDNYTFLAQYLLKRKPKLAKAFSAARSAKKVMELFVENYDELTRPYELYVSKKERTFRG